MQTTLQFAEAEGKLQMVTTVIEDDEAPLLEMQYGPAATVWRMNFGWRRRKEKSIQGFMMNPVTGHWVGGVEESGEEADATSDAPPDKTPPQRILPYVEDRRNILVVRPHSHLGVISAETLTTLQYALKRGIEAVYQLEESELMAQPHIAHTEALLKTHFPRFSETLQSTGLTIKKAVTEFPKWAMQNAGSRLADEEMTRLANELPLKFRLPVVRV